MTTINTTQDAVNAGIEYSFYMSLADRIAALKAEAACASGPTTYGITVKDGLGDPVTLTFATSEAHFAFLVAFAP